MVYIADNNLPWDLCRGEFWVVLSYNCCWPGWAPAGDHMAIRGNVFLMGPMSRMHAVEKYAGWARLGQPW